MNNEIKDILEEFEWYIKQPNNQDINGEYEPPMEISQDEAKSLLDYITNLQQENERLRENINNAKEFIEKHRIREMSIVEVNALEGILNE